MSTFVIGLSIGTLLFLLAAGLTLIFGMLRIINFAHGALYMLGAYLAYQIALWLGFWWALLLVPPLLALVGVLIERLTLRPIYSAPHEFQLLITFGLILVLEEVVRFTWGLSGKSIATPAALSGSVSMFGTDLSTNNSRPHFGGFDGSNDRALYFLTLGIVAVCVAVLLACQHGRFGRMLAAMAEVPSVLSTSGLRLNVTRLLVVCISAFFAGIAGALANTLSTAASAIRASPLKARTARSSTSITCLRRRVSK